VAALIALMSAVAAITRANWANIWPVRPGTKAAGMNTDISTRVMPMTAQQLVHGLMAAVVGRQAALDMTRDALDDDDGVVDHDADRQHDAEHGRRC